MSTYTEDWFTKRIPEWKNVIVPQLADRPVNWLELGSYEGRSAVWTLENILTHPQAQLTCVDLWRGDYEKNFDANLAPYMAHGNVEKLKGDCFDILAQLTCEKRVFHGIYVDADHQAKSALTEAAIGWRMLAKGGFLIFDDYPWKHPTAHDRKTKLPPKPGIDAFLECWQYEMRVLHKGWQVIVQKI